MKITIINQEEEYIAICDHMSIRIDKPITLDEVKKVARDYFEMTCKKVSWEIIN